MVVEKGIPAKVPARIKGVSRLSKDYLKLP